MKAARGEVEAALRGLRCERDILKGIREEMGGREGGRKAGEERGPREEWRHLETRRVTLPPCFITDEIETSEGGREGFGRQGGGSGICLQQTRVGRVSANTC